MQNSKTDLMLSQIKVSEKNITLSSKYHNNHHHSGSTQSETVFPIIQEASSGKHSSFNESLTNLIDPVFIVPPSQLKKLLPFPPKLRKNQKNPSTSDDYFDLLQTQVYLELIPDALKTITSASSVFSEQRFKLWEALIYIRYPKYLGSDTESCCGSRRVLEKSVAFSEIMSNLLSMKQSVETLWLMMEMSLEGMLKLGKQIEDWQYYARQIKAIDRYYGYLAWAICSIKNHKPIGLRLLHGLAQREPTVPYSYIFLWNYYDSHILYVKAFDIATEAYIKVTNDKFSEFFQLIVLIYSKSLTRLKQVDHSLIVLLQKYRDNQTSLHYLYQFGKLCIKSRVQAYKIAGLGALKEVSRWVKGYLKLNFWLGKAFYKTCRLGKAQKYFEKISNVWGSKEIKMKLSLRRTLEKICKAQNFLKDFEGKIDTKALESVFRSRSGSFGDILRIDQVRNLIKSSNNEIALRILSYINRVEAFEILVGRISSEMDFDKADFVLKNTLEKLSQGEIPTFEFIKACFLYTDFLLLHNRNKKGLLILKSLLKFYPSWSTAMPYITKALESHNFQNPLLSESEVTEIPNYKLRGFVVKCIKLRTEEDQLAFSNRGKIKHKRSISLPLGISGFSSNFPEAQLDDGSPMLPYMIANFSTYTSPSVLLRIAQYTSLTDKAEAKEALADYLKIATQAHQKEKAKALQRLLG